MLFNTIVFQALAASLAVGGVSAQATHRRPRRQLPAIPALPVPAPPGLLEPIASPLGKLESQLVPGGITILPALNTAISNLAVPLSSALPVIAPVLSDVTQLFPVSGSSAAPSTSSGFATQTKGCSAGGGGPTSTSTKKPTPKPHKPKTTKKAAKPTPTSKSGGGGGSGGGSGGGGGGGGGGGKPKTVTKTVTVTASGICSSSTTTSAPAASSSAATCGPNFLPCLLEPVASLVKSIVPPITALPAVNTIVSQVVAAVSSAVPELSTPKEITDKILPVN
ncbi:hypothetical protein RQP46_009126 [Phenoliferia psychrophenolica]